MYYLGTFLNNQCVVVTCHYSQTLLHVIIEIMGHVLPFENDINTIAIGTICKQKISQRMLRKMCFLGRNKSFSEVVAT